MGKHSGPADAASGTDSGKAWEKLTAEQKGQEFDNSLQNPRGYAERNFGAGQSRGEQYDTVREEQRGQQDGRR